MTLSIIIASIAFINAYLHITYASPQNECSSSNGEIPTDPDGAYINSNNKQRSGQISNFGNGNYKKNVINVDATSNGYSVSTYERDRNDGPSVNNCNGNFNEPPRYNNRQVPERSQSRFNQNERPLGESNQSQGALRKMLIEARIGQGNNNNNEIYVNGQRVYLDPNQEGNRGNNARAASGTFSFGPTVFLIMLATMVGMRIF